MEASETQKFKPGKVSLIALSHLAHDVYPAFLAPLLPILKENLGLSYTMLGMLIFLREIPSVFTPLIGIYADKYNFRPFAFISPAVSAIAMSLLLIAPHYYVMAILLLITGVSTAFFHVPTPVMIRHFSGNRLGMGMSFFMFGGELARTLGPLLILFAISLLGMKWGVLVVIPGIIMSFILMISIRHIPYINNTSGRVSNLKTILQTWRNLKKLFIVIIGLIISKAFMIKALTSFLPTFLTGRGADLWIAGASLSILQLAGAFGAITSGTVSDKIGRKNMLMIITISAPLFMAVFIYSGGWIFYPMLVILGFISYSLNPILLTLVQENEKNFPASANSIFMSLNFIMSASAGFLFGVLGDLFTLNTIYIISAAISVIGIPFVLALPKDRRQTV